jgi:hypothetical protein
MKTFVAIIFLASTAIAHAEACDPPNIAREVEATSTICYGAYKTLVCPQAGVCHWQMTSDCKPAEIEIVCLTPEANKAALERGK